MFKGRLVWLGIETDRHRMVNPEDPTTGLLGREPTKPQRTEWLTVLHKHAWCFQGTVRWHLCISSPRFITMEGKKKHLISKRSIIHPLSSSESCPVLEKQIGEDNKRSRGWPRKSQQHQALGADFNTNYFLCKPGTFTYCKRPVLALLWKKNCFDEQPNQACFIPVLHLPIK